MCQVSLNPHFFQAEICKRCILLKVIFPDFNEFCMAVMISQNKSKYKTTSCITLNFAHSEHNAATAWHLCGIKQPKKWHNSGCFNSCFAKQADTKMTRSASPNNDYVDMILILNQILISQKKDIYFCLLITIP